MFSIAHVRPCDCTATASSTPTCSEEPSTANGRRPLLACSRILHGCPLTRPPTLPLCTPYSYAGCTSMVASPTDEAAWPTHVKTLRRCAACPPTHIAAAGRDRVRDRVRDKVRVRVGVRDRDTALNQLRQEHLFLVDRRQPALACMLTR